MALPGSSLRGWRSRPPATMEGGRTASWLCLRSADARAQAELRDLLDEVPIRAHARALGGSERPDERLHESADDAGRGDRGIEPREDAAHDAFAQDALEAVRELSPIVQTHRLDFRIDGFGDQGVGEASAAQRTAGEGADGGLQLPDGRAVGVGQRLHDLDLTGGDGRDDLRAQLGLRGKVAIDG